MALTVTVLGTSSMVPTKDRNVQAFLLDYNGELLLVDCGEGTQRQMNIAGFSRARVRKVLITHWHGDHVGGLISLIQTIFNADYQETLHLYGPKGSKERLDHLRKSVDFENPVDIEVHELDPKKDEILAFFENDEYVLECAALRHGIPTLAYAFTTKAKRRVNMDAAGKYGLKQGPLVGRLQRGETVTFKEQTISPDDVCYFTASKKLAIVPDTAVTNVIPALAENADVMLCESTYAGEHEEKAAQYKHMTAAQAAMLAQQANASRLVLTHFSQRYTHVGHLVDEAKVHFPETQAAFDFMTIKL